MDFNSFRRSKANMNSENRVSHDTINNTSNKSSVEDNINRTLDTYSKMSKDEMMHALFGAVNNEKSKGLFDINNIWAFYNEVSPMLDEDNRKRMHDIIESIELGNY